MKELLLIASLAIQIQDGKGPLTMQLRDVELKNVFFVDLANDVRVRPSVYVRDTPWDRILANMIASAGLTYTIKVDPTKLVVGSEPATDACRIAGDLPIGVIPPKPEEMKASDLEIAGVARVGDQWKAYAYGWGRLHILEKGTPLAGAKVDAVRANGVVISGALRPLKSTAHPKASDR